MRQVTKIRLSPVTYTNSDTRTNELRRQVPVISHTRTQTHIQICRAGKNILVMSRIRIETLSLCITIAKPCSDPAIRSAACVAVCCGALQCVAMSCSVLQRVAACCSVLQRVAACCSVLQRVACSQIHHALILQFEVTPECMCVCGGGFVCLCECFVLVLKYVSVCACTHTNTFTNTPQTRRHAPKRRGGKLL